jgi:hypothetical protein
VPLKTDVEVAASDVSCGPQPEFTLEATGPSRETMYHVWHLSCSATARARVGGSSKTETRSDGVGPYRKNKYLTSAAAPKMSTIRTSRRTRPSAQFQTIYVSWSTMSAATRHLANVGRHPQNPAYLPSRSDRPSEVPRREHKHRCRHLRLDR